MRKHFLILMLLTLLPLAGWAQTVEFGEVGLGKYTYGSGTVPEPVVKDKEGAILTKTTHYTVTDGIFSDEACTSLIAVGDYKNLKCDGTKYYRQVIGVGAYVDEEAHPWFTVDKAEVTVDLKGGGLTKKYGEDDPALTAADIDWISAVGFKYTDDESVFDLSSVSYTHSGVNASAVAYPVTVSGATADHYTLTINGGITINPRDFIAANVTVAISNNEVTYDGTDTQTATVTVTDKKFGALELGKDFEVTYSGGHKDVGNYDITVSGLGNYSADNIAGDKQLKIGKATILATPKATRVYDGTKTLPAVTKDRFEYSGFVDAKTSADVIVGGTTWESDANLAKDVKADYVLNVKVNELTVSGGNYQVVPMPGTFAITKKAVEIYADDQTVGYGSDIKTDAMIVEDLSGEITGWGTANTGDLARIKRAVIVYKDGDVLKVKANDAAAEADKKLLANYNPAYNKNGGADATGTLTYTKGTITIALNPEKVTLTKAYDGTPAAITEDVTNKDNLTIIGTLVGTDQLVLTGLKATVVDNNGDASAAGYKVTLSGATVSANADKYTINYVTTYYKVTKKALTVTINPQSTKVGTAEASAIDYDLFKVEGLVGTDKQENIFKLTLDGEVITAAAINATHEGETDNWILLSEKVVGAANNYSGWDAATGKLTIVPATAIILSDDVIGDIADADNATVTFENRQFKAGVWETLVLPFATSVRNISKVLGYAVVDMLQESGEDMNFKLYMGEIPAFTPFLVKTDADVNLNTVYFTGDTKVNVKKLTDELRPNLTKSNDSYNFIGQVEYVAINSTWWAKGSKMTADHFEFNKYKSGAKCKAMRAYITAKDGGSTAPRIFVEEPDGTVTAISCISAEGTAVPAEGWYTVNGIKLESAPTQKGIYIRNGKKMVIR